MNNTRFATALHILTLLSTEPGHWMSSDWIAGSINVNPVVVRRELATLKKAGFIESRVGKEGGCRLAKQSSEILVSEVYTAVKNSEVLGKKNQNPNPKCPVGKKINLELDSLFRDTDRIVSDFLGKRSLADFSSSF